MSGTILLPVTATCPTSTTTITNSSGDCLDASLIPTSGAAATSTFNSTIFATCNQSATQNWNLEYSTKGNGFTITNSGTSGGSLCLDGGGGPIGTPQPFIYMNGCSEVGANGWQTWTPTTSSSSGITLTCQGPGFNFCLNDTVNYHTPLSTCLALDFTT
jgi:hypothetical protein